MSYNRLDDDYYDHSRPMNNRPPPHRTPSPGHPIQHGYQLDDNPYGRQQANASNLDIPMGPGRYTSSDQLQLHTAHSVANLSEPSGYHGPPGAYHDEYAVNPEQHHDAYYNQSYQPTPMEGAYDHDGRPLLNQKDSYGMDQPYRDNPNAQAQAGGGLKRWKTVKKVPLYRGNLVLDCPVPPKLLNQLPHTERDEFTHMRYTAATCDPNDFYESNFTLRQQLFSKPRQTELFIVVTMYNEDEILFARTMIGVFKNIEYMCRRPESKTWGKEAWKKIVVCVVSDGRAKINPRTKALLAGMGVYQEGIARQQVDEKETTAHIYEYTTQVGMAIKNDVVTLIPKQQPVQVLFCLKEKNQKKINSHRWFFSAFGRVLNPNICVLLDAGTKPGGNSIYHLWKAFDLEPMCAGACGEIKAMLGNCLTPDTMVRTTKGLKAIRDITIGDNLFDDQDNPVQCIEAEDIKTSDNMKKVIYTEYHGLSKTSFTCTPNHIMTLVAYGVKPGLTDKGFGVHWFTRCDRTMYKKEEESILWDQVMHSLFTELEKDYGRTPTDGEVRQYLRAITRRPIVPDSEDDSQDVKGKDLQDLQSPALVALLDQLKTMGLEIEDHDSMILLLLQEHMEEYLETRIPEQEDVPEAESGPDDVVDLDGPRKRHWKSLATIKSRSSDVSYRTPEPQSESESQNPSASQASSYVSANSAAFKESLLERYKEIRAMLMKTSGQGVCACHPHCKGLRRVQLRFKTKEQAQETIELLNGPHSTMVDPYAVKHMDLFTMTMEEYLATCTAAKQQHKHKKLRLYRAPLRFEPFQGPVAPVPIDPYWLGFWLGDGNKKDTGITSSDRELKVWLEGYCDRLNSNRDPEAPPMQVTQLPHHKAGDVRTIRGQQYVANSDCWLWYLTTGTLEGLEGRNPIWTGLKDLGLRGDKSPGIPDCYMNANEDTRLAVLAGLIESDGWLESKTQCYAFAQTTYEHKKIVYDARKLAVSCGIHCTDVVESQSPRNKEPSWRFYMSKGCEKFQHHLLLPRKRLNMTSRVRYNRDTRTFDVEDAGQGEYRLIEVSGALFQLADRTVVHNCGKNLLNPLVAAQNFEYKMSNILDKPLESAFGFISVLPGAFSAYRYIALQNDKNGQGPLEKYFAGEKLHGAGAGIFTANMYLAEDRILCFELVTKRNCSWILQYVKSATGETDVPDTATELILQRRRWLNGSFFAAIYAIAHFYQFFRSDHSFFRKIAFFIEFGFNTINMIFAWFAIGNFFLVFKILVTSLGDPKMLGTPGVYLGITFEWLYGISLITCFVLAMGNRPAGSGPYYMAMVVFWAIIYVYLLFAAIYIAYVTIDTNIRENKMTPTELLKDKVVVTLILSVLSTYGIWLIASLLMFDPWHMITSLVQYLLLSPTFTNVLNVYAFCNTHDISWGTKGDDKPDKLPSVSTKDGEGKADLPDEGDLNAMYERELRVFATKFVEAKKDPTPSQLEEKQLDYYRGVRTVVVLLWMVMNFALAAVVLSTAGVDRIAPAANPQEAEERKGARATLYMGIVLYSVAALSGFKFIGACWFLVVRMFRGV